MKISQDHIVTAHMADGGHINGGWADSWLILTIKSNFHNQDLFNFFPFQERLSEGLTPPLLLR